MHPALCVLPAAHEILVHRIRRLAAGAHGQDNGGRARHDVPAGPDAFFEGFAGGFIRFDVTPFVQLQIRGGGGQKGVGP